MGLSISSRSNSVSFSSSLYACWFSCSVCSLDSSLLNRRFRTRSLFLTAMALFVAGTVLCAAAPRFDLLIGGRLIQGVGTGIALPLMFNVVLKQVPLDRLGTMIYAQNAPNYSQAQAQTMNQGDYTSQPQNITQANFGQNNNQFMDEGHPIDIKDLF